MVHSNVWTGLLIMILDSCHAVFVAVLVAVLVAVCVAVMYWPTHYES